MDAKCNAVYILDMFSLIYECLAHIQLAQSSMVYRFELQLLCVVQPTLSLCIENCHSESVAWISLNNIRPDYCFSLSLSLSLSLLKIFCLLNALDFSICGKSALNHCYCSRLDFWICLMMEIDLMCLSSVSPFSFPVSFVFLYFSQLFFTVLLFHIFCVCVFVWSFNRVS